MVMCGADVRGGCMGGGNVEYWYASAVGYPPYMEIDKRVYAYASTLNFFYFQLSNTPSH